MLVKDVLSLSALMLGDDNLKTYISGGEVPDADTTENDYATLLNCYNIVADELSREYVKLTYTESFTPINGEVSYERFTFNPIIIKSVKNSNGGEVNYRINPIKIYVNEPVVVEYVYAVPERNISDECDFSCTAVSKRIIAYGVVCEYCLVKGRFEEAVTWRDKYSNGLQAVLSYKKSRKIIARKWF